MFKRILTAVMAVVLAVNVIPVSALTVQAEETEYEIYPVPHSVDYHSGTFTIGEEVNVIFEEEIDEVTQNKLANVLEENGISMDPNEEMSDSRTNILVGVKDSGEFADQYADENISYAEGTFADNHYDAYVLDVSDGTITVLGDTTDGAFYGIVTLMHILDQAKGGVIRNLTVSDYADTAIRGFIEGYYGIPWSNEDRMSLMEFGGQFKMTCYIFAPKNDPYHREKWREMYPADELAQIKEMVELGNANKCRFVWTAHPFLGGFDANDAENEIDSLLAKFDQLYSIGVRQFGVLADDAGSISYDTLIQIMTAVSEWAVEKGDVYDSVFCPAGYNHSWQGNYDELNALDASFPENVQIFWTGEAVCNPVETTTLDHFRNYNVNEDGKTQRRAPLFWLNWPVNDINSARILMGKGSMLHTDIDVEDLAGVITNPMQEAEASKVSLFAVADYSWNVKDFDEDQSWEDCFAYIDAEASEELYTLAKHMSDPSPNGHGLVLEESAQLQPLLEDYQTKLDAGTLTQADHDTLAAEFQKIADACDDFHKKSENEALKEELLSFTNSLKDQAMAAIEFIETQRAIESGDENDAWNHYSQATAYLSGSKTYTKELLDGGTTNAAPGAKRITPFVESLSAVLSPLVNSMIDDSKLITTYITSRTDTPSGSVDNIMDGDVTTGAIYQTPNSISEGEYIGVKFSKSILVEDIHFVLGAGKDHFDQGKLQYTTDGTEWNDITLVDMNNEFNGVSGQVQEIVVGKTNLPENFTAKGIRFIATKDNASDAWLEVREIAINETAASEDETEETYTGTVFVPEGFSIYAGYDETNITDGSDSTFAWYQTPNNTVAEGQYVGLDLGEAKEIGMVHFAMPAGDCLSNYTLQYSMDGTTYTDIQTFTSLTADVDLSGQGISARYLRAYNNTSTGMWLKVASFSVSKPVTTEKEVFTNKEALSGFTADIQEAAGTLTGTGSITLAPGEYVGLDLERIKDISKITVDGAGALTLQVSKNNIVWNDVNVSARAAEYEDARYVRLINKTNADVTTTLTSLLVESHEIQPVSVEATNFGSTDTHLYAFDGDRTTEAVLQASQNAGHYITYDLGQEIDLESLKLVLHDGTTDYPRHAKVSVSADNDTWTTVMTIGNQDADNEGEAENTDNIADLFPVHEISYYTLEAENIDQQVRYIRFEITRNKAGADKWVRIREIELNGGDMYLPESNDPTIITDGVESAGNTAANMKDGDLSTTFQPVGNAAGSFTYSFSEKTDIKRINILQSPATVSNAVVTAEVYVQNEVKTVTLGKLSESFNKFNTSAYDHVLSITVTWKKGSVPCIQEIITLNTVDTELDKSALYQKYNEVFTGKEENGYTVASWNTFKQALNNADQVLLDSGATAEQITAAISALEAAESGLVASTAKERLKELYDLSLTEADYTSTSWSRFANARTDVTDIVNNISSKNDNEINGALTKLESAYKALVTKLQEQIDQLNAKVEEAEEKEEDAYTPNSWSALKEALDQAKNALNNTASADLSKAVEALQTAMSGLVERAEKMALQAEINQAPESTKKSDYTSASWSVFEEKLAEAKKVLENLNADAAMVADATNALTKARNGLVTATDLTRLQEQYTELKDAELSEEDYTSESWAAYKAAVEAAKHVIDQSSASQAAAALENLQNAYDALETTLQGSIRALKAKVTEAEALEKGSYTDASWNTFKEALSKAKFVSRFSAFKKKADIESALDTLTAAMTALAAPADKGALNDLIAGVPSSDKKEEYTSRTWAALETALKAANAVAENTDATDSEIQTAVTDLQAAVSGLVKRGDKTDLTALVNECKTKSEKDYTAETWSAFKAALEKAQAVVADKDATIQDVTDVKAALETAVKNLVEAPEYTWNATNGGVLEFEIGLAKENISNVYICSGDNMTELSKDHYEVKTTSLMIALFTSRSAGTTIVLKEEYLKTLASGTYTLRVMSGDGEAIDNVFQIEAAVVSPEEPPKEPSKEPTKEPAGDGSGSSPSHKSDTTTNTTTTTITTVTTVNEQNVTTTAAKTADDSNAAAWMTMLALCGAAFIFLRSKKEEAAD